MGINFYNFLTVTNTILGSLSFKTNHEQDRTISSIQDKLSYIQDDINWIESNDVNQLLADQAALRSKYEKDLAKFFFDKQSALELDAAISALSQSASFSDPKIYNIMLASVNNINLLLNSTSEVLVQMFDINEATLDKVLNLINEINSLKLKFNLNDADLQLRISENSRLIIKLSEQQLAHQLSTLQSFDELRNDLEIINSQVDKKLADFGVLSTNTTGVILNDGTFKLSDTLDLINTEIFDITFSDQEHNSSTSQVRINGNNPVNCTIPSVNDLSRLYGGSFPYTLMQASASCNILKLLTSNLIKRFSNESHSGVGLLLNRPYKLLVANIDPHRELFLFLKGAGLSDFNSNGLSVEFIPSLVKWRPIESAVFGSTGGTKPVPTYRHISGQARVKNVTWGEFGSYKVPSSNQSIKIGSIFTSSVIQKSDKLIVIKVKLSTNFSSIIASGTFTGAIISGTGCPNGENPGVVNGGSFVKPDPGDLLAGGSFIINLPVNYLSFSGVECAQ